MLNQIRSRLHKSNEGVRCRKTLKEWPLRFEAALVSRMEIILSVRTTARALGNKAIGCEVPKDPLLLVFENIRQIQNFLKDLVSGIPLSSANSNDFRLISKLSVPNVDEIWWTRTSDKSRFSVSFFVLVYHSIVAKIHYDTKNFFSQILWANYFF